MLPHHLLGFGLLLVSADLPLFVRGETRNKKDVSCAACENTSITVRNVPEYMRKIIQAMFLNIDSRNPACEWGIARMETCAQPEVLFSNLMVDKCYTMRRITTAIGIMDLFPEAIFEVNYYRRGCTKQFVQAQDGCFDLKDLGTTMNGKLSYLKNMLLKKWMKVKDSGRLCIYDSEF